MNFILQFSRTYAMYHNEIVLVMGDCKIQVFFKCIQLDRQNFKVVQVFPLRHEFFNVQVHLIFCGFEMLPA